MKFTGERYVPSERRDIRYEHVHRYALSREFAIGKTVLDIACGEGYGAALLAEAAASVTGVDIDPDTIEHARKAYAEFGNLTFLAGACDSVPLADQSVDLVTSFETIEHHDKHREMMREIKRVLHPAGMLIISSPNRAVYSDEAGYANPFHVKELYREDLVRLLEEHFRFVEIYGQKIVSGSFVCPVQGTGGGSLKSYSSDGTSVDRTTRSLSSPLYFMAMCSDREMDPLRHVLDSVYTEPDDDLLEASRSESAHVQLLLQQTHEQLGLVQGQLATKDAEVGQLKAIVHLMRSSRFWKLRNKIKRLLGSPDEV